MKQACHLRKLLIAPILAALCLGAAGCSDSTTPPAPEPMDFPSTPDKLMANFQTAYETMDPYLLAKGTHALSEIILEAATTNTFPDVGSTLDREEQRNIAERMLSKQDLFDPNGSLIPALQFIQFQTFRRSTAWEPSLPADPIQGAEAATYAVVFQFLRGQNYSPLKVAGDIRFFVTHRDSTSGGQARPFYQIRGQLDLTDLMQADLSEKNDEISAWGSVLAMFR